MAGRMALSVFSGMSINMLRSPWYCQLSCSRCNNFVTHWSVAAFLENTSMASLSIWHSACSRPMSVLWWPCPLEFPKTWLLLLNIKTLDTSWKHYLRTSLSPIHDNERLSCLSRALLVTRLWFEQGSSCFVAADEKASSSSVGFAFWICSSWCPTHLAASRM